MEEESKAIQEVAKATGKGIDAVREAGGFIARYVAGPLEEGVGILSDRLKYVRWERQVRLMQRADQFLREAGLEAPSRAVPLKIAIPLLQAATIEDDDSLQDLFAALLVNAANAASGVEVHRSFIEILSQITPLEARILNVIYSLPFDEARHAGIITDALPDSVRILAEKEDATQQPSDEIALALGNLVRVGCVKVPGTWGGGETFSSVNPTLLGREFVRACTTRQRKTQ
ncbi:protein of unknown function [Rhodoferax sp. OV413]|uniref:Abi-alpha family protein n=1 Tax=Rhodoferax sp. OV413 TaxID=1855285 RepID=UPI00088492E0|nr:Abi-alpha family protein [Rhodoferax sp. OV413]SDP94207.1 protein of unknown function [Rhodoferax sp. OV413]